MRDSSLSRDRSAKPDSVIDRKSPPLPFTARTRTGLPVSGSGSSNLELVLPPPKFVIRRSAPSRFERYRRSASGRDARLAAGRSSQRFCTNFVTPVAVSGTGKLHVVLETTVLGIPSFGGGRFESLYRKRSLDRVSRAGNRADRAGRHHLHRDVPERRRLDRSRHDRPARRVGRELIQQLIPRPAADDSNHLEAGSGQPLERFEHRAILEREAFQNRPRTGRGCRRLWLPRLTAILADALRHVLGIQEHVMVRIDERPK